MKLAELIRRVRVDGNDNVAPYFWSDADITAWLNDAVAEAALRGRLIHESEDAAVCEIAVEAERSAYPLHQALFELTYVGFLDDGACQAGTIRLVSTEWLDANQSDWRARRGSPLFAVQSDKGLRLVPKPSGSGKLILEGYRLPLAHMDFQRKDEDEPEIGEAHHSHLVQWPLHRGFSIPDMESFDARRADIAEAAFTAYFGLRPDSDLRRVTREDVPHHVEAFWL